MDLSEGTTEKIPSDTTGDQSRDRPTSSLNHYAIPGPIKNCTLVKTQEELLRIPITWKNMHKSMTIDRFSIVDFSYEGRSACGIARAERDGTRAGTRFRLSPKRTSPFKSVGASVQSTAGS